MSKISQKRNIFVVMRYHVIFFIFFSFGLVTTTNAQTKKEIQQKRKKLREETQLIKKLLFKSKQEEESLLSDLEDINKVINVRSRLISTIKQEEEELSIEIEKNKQEISTLEKRLNILKKEYANMVVQSYKSKTKQSRLMFLLSSESFTQAYKRLQYLKQYSTYRKKQGIEIKDQAAKIIALNDSLVVKQDEKVLLIALHNKEQDSIKGEKNSQLRLVKRAKSKEKEYLAQIKAKEQEDARLGKQLQNLIKAAIAKSNKEKGKKSSGFILSPEEKLVGSNFLANKGKLPWPIRRYIIVRKFGKQKHPTMPGIMLTSNGLHLATEKNAKARAVFKGKVLAIQLQPGRKKMVLIQHGNYTSVYKNLKTVSVKKGQSISTKQEIGTIHTNAITGKTILEFGLFKNASIVNPEPWISKPNSMVLASK